MNDTATRSAPDFKAACIVMFGVNITWVFVLVWAIWGLIVVGILGATINHMMTRLHERAIARAALDRRAPRAKARS